MDIITIIMAITFALLCVGIVVGSYRQDTLFSFMVRRKTLNKYLVRISDKNKEISKLEGLLKAYKEMLDESNLISKNLKEDWDDAEAELKESREEFNYVKGLLKRAKEDLRRTQVGDPDSSCAEIYRRMHNEADDRISHLERCLHWASPLLTKEQRDALQRKVDTPVSKAFSIWTWPNCPKSSGRSFDVPCSMEAHFSWPTDDPILLAENAKRVIPVMMPRKLPTSLDGRWLKWEMEAHFPDFGECGRTVRWTVSPDPKHESPFRRQ